MKLSKILVSVNLAAAIPIAAQTAGQAAEKAVSDKAAWLKDSLVSIEKGRSLSCDPAVAGKNIRKVAERVPATNPISQLRSFVPNRKLPTQKEVDQQMLAQAPDAAAALNAKIPSYYSQDPSDYLNNAWASSRAAKSGTAFSGTGEGQFPTSANLPAENDPANRAAGGALEPSRVPAQVGFNLMRQAEQKLMVPQESASESQSDQAMIDQYAQTTSGQSDLQTPGTAGSAGPPPFPLSLLPEASLKQLMRGMVRPTGRSSAPGAYFGCWHHGQEQNRFAGSRALPQGGFHSYLHGGGFMSRSNVRTQLASCRHSYAPKFIQSRPARNMVPAPRLSSQAYFAPQRQLALAQQKHLPLPYKAAVYPPYTSQTGVF